MTPPARIFDPASTHARSRARSRVRSLRGPLVCALGSSFLVLGLHSPGVAGQTSPSTITDAEIAASQTVDDIFSQWDSEMSAGCAVGVKQFGETLLERAYGMADLEHGIANESGTIFEGGSVSKQFTSAAVILLVLDGVLSLDDDVRQYVPELPDYGHTITIHHLMTHTSGLRDWGSVASISGWGRGDRSHDHEDVIDILSRQTELNFEPGNEYSYSNSGYNLMAVIVDRVSGMSFADFSRQRIFEPLGMTDTQWRANYRQIVPGRSTAYRRAREGWEIDRPIEYVHGNGGILSTVEDLATWNQALTDGGPWGDRFLELMHTQGELNDGTTISYAGGLFVGDLGGVSSVTHTGATAGYRAFLGRYPEQGLSVAMLCNASNVAVGRLGAEIATAYLGDAVREDPTPDFAAASSGIDFAPFIGYYADPATFRPIAVEVRDSVLQMRSGTGQTMTPLFPETSTRFRLGSSDRYYDFERAGSEVSGIRVVDGESFDRRFDRVEPWVPRAEELEALKGTYRSEDAETTFVIDVEESELTVWQRPNDTRGAVPLYRDTFMLSNGSMLRFWRDDSGGVTALSLGISRVYDMRFERIE